MYLSRWAKFKFLRRVASYCTNIPEFKKWPLTKKVPFESHRLKKKLNIKRFSTPKRDLNSASESQNVRIFPMAIVKIPQNAQDLLVMPLNRGFDASSSSSQNKQAIFKDSLNLVVENTTDIMNIVQCLAMLDFKTNTIDFNEESIDIKEIIKEKNMKQKPAETKSQKVAENVTKAEEINTIEEINVEDDHKIENKIQNFNKVERREDYIPVAKAQNASANVQNVKAKVKKDFSEIETESIEKIENTKADIKTQPNVLDENVNVEINPPNLSGTMKTENIKTETMRIEQPRAPPILMQSAPFAPVNIHREEIVKTVPSSPSSSSASLDIAKIASNELAKIANADHLAQSSIPSIRDMQLKLVLDLPDLKEIAKMKKENRPKNLLVNFNVHFNGVANLKFEDVERALNNSNDVNQMSSGLASSICTLALKNFIAANNNKIPEIKNVNEVFTTDCNVKDTQYSIAIKKNPSADPNEAPPK